VIDPEGAPLEKIIEASQNCPVDAIIITGPDGVQIYP
jgi:ferredoxin